MSTDTDMIEEFRARLSGTSDGDLEHLKRDLFASDVYWSQTDPKAGVAREHYIDVLKEQQRRNPTDEHRAGARGLVDSGAPANDPIGAETDVLEQVARLRAGGEGDAADRLLLAHQTTSAANAEATAKANADAAAAMSHISDAGFVERNHRDILSDLTVRARGAERAGDFELRDQLMSDYFEHKDMVGKERRVDAVASDRAQVEEHQRGVRDQRAGQMASADAVNKQ